MEEATPKEESVTFLNHMLKFNDSTKHELTNISQYVLLAIIPVIGLNKLMKKYIPPADEDKSSLEVSFEIVLQLLVLFFGLFYIHRFVTFFKPYSGTDYPEISIISVILAILLITFSIQSKLGEKGNLMVERLHDLWDGETSLKQEKAKKKEIAKPVQHKATPNYHVPQNNPAEPPRQEPTKQELPNYNLMYHNVATHDEEPQFLAANEALGGGFGSMY